MTQTEQEEMDLDSMSIDELETLATQMEQGETSDDSVEVQEETVETSDQAEEEGQDSTEAETSSQEVELVTDPDMVEDLDEDVVSDSPFMKKKKAKDLLEMHQNASKKISQQDNKLHMQNSEIYQMRKQLEELQSQHKANSEKVIQSADDEMLSKYQKEDIDAINRIIERNIQKREQSKFQETQAERETVAKEHDEIWDNLQTFNPQLFLSIKEDAMNTMQADPANTYQKKGWLKQFILMQAQASVNTGDNGQTTQNKTGVKRRAVTVGSGSKANTKTARKSVDDMSPDEYADYARNDLGFKDF